MTIVDLIEVPSLGDARISPDGTRLLFVRRDADWEENGTAAHIWRVDADGENLIQVTNGENGGRRARAGRPTGAASPSWPGAARTSTPRSIC